MRLIIAATLGLFIIQPLSAEPELKGSPAELAAHLANLPKTVGVAGESEVKVQADRAIVALKVTTENKSLQEALRANQEIRGKILNSLKDRGISPERIQASKFSSTPKYGLFGEKAKSYRVENILKVTVHEDKEFQATALLVDTLAEVQYQGIDFEHSDKDALKKKTLVQALDDAMATKKVYEERLGVRLTAKGVSQSAVARTLPQRPPVYYDKAFSQVAGKSGYAQPSAEASAIEEIGSLFGEIVFTGRVVIDYVVEAK